MSENPQEATSFSLSILEYGKTASDEEQKLIAALYLMSWANLQFRLGNTIEGVACAIISINKLLKLKEVTPVLEEGLNVLSKYLGTYDELFLENEKKEILESVKMLEKYNESFQPLYYKYSDDVTEILQNYEEKIKKCEEKDSHWLIDLSNLIAGKIKNKEIAMNILKSKLHTLEVEKRNKEINDLKGNSNIDFGSQIRNYVLEPYSLVKDVRTNYETSNHAKVLDGDIYPFIEAYLRMKR